MNVVMIGTGYVGLVSGTCFAEMGHTVTCVDIDQEKINMLKQGKSPIYEPGLNDMLAKNIESKRLFFSTDYEAVENADCAFLAVGTPSSNDGSADLTYLKEAAKSVAKRLRKDGIVVIKSTVPVGTHKIVEDVVGQNTDVKFHVVNNPEFLKEGAAIDDFMTPDRIVIGHNDEFAAEKMEELYRPLMLQGNPIYMMSNLSAEVTKYAANCMLATKISFINEMARLCDATGADINEVRKGITSDKRIGHHFLYPGPGYGGSCFPKDVKALIKTAKEHSIDLKIVEAAEEVNDKQRSYMAEKIKNYFKGALAGKTITFWGLSFKPKTDDVRETPAYYSAKLLIEAGAKLHVFDPIATDNYMKLMKDHNSAITTFNDKYEALNSSDGLFLVTEWNEFRAPDFKKIKTLLRTPVVFDGRNIYQTEEVLGEDLDYFAIGKFIK